MSDQRLQSIRVDCRCGACYSVTGLRIVSVLMIPTPATRPPAGKCPHCLGSQTVSKWNRTTRQYQDYECGLCGPSLWEDLHDDGRTERELCDWDSANDGREEVPNE